MTPTVEFIERPRGYTVNGERVPSVTEVLGTVIDKSRFLKGWAANETLKAVCELAGQGVELASEYDDLKAQLKAHRLGYYYANQGAIERGKAVHAAAESWVLGGVVPSAGDYPDEVRPFVVALGRFLVDHQPEFLFCERVVGSARHGFAGTYDALARRADGRTVRFDWKTSKRVDPSFFAQLDAYDLAAQEMGEDPADVLAVVRLGADGDYEYVESRAERGCFLAFLEAFRVLKTLEAGLEDAA